MPDSDPRRIKSWIRIRIEVEILELWRLKMEPRRAVDSNNGGVVAQNKVLKGV
jgi:hypothetical protein